LESLVFSLLYSPLGLCSSLRRGRREWRFSALRLRKLKPNPYSRLSLADYDEDSQRSWWCSYRVKSLRREIRLNGDFFLRISYDRLLIFQLSPGNCSFRCSFGSGTLLVINECALMASKIVTNSGLSSTPRDYSSMFSVSYANKLGEDSGYRIYNLSKFLPYQQ
jgi:hypothetical protein